MAKLKSISKLNSLLEKLQELSEQVREELEEKREWWDGKSEKWQESESGADWDYHLVQVENLLDDIYNLEKAE